MSIDYPETPREIDQRGKTDVQRALPSSNPYLKNSLLGALITGCSLRVFDFYTQMKELEKQLFFKNATGRFLSMFGAWFGITLNAATRSKGIVVITGTVGATVARNAELRTEGADQYITLSSSTVAESLVNLALLERNGQTATATTMAPHNLASLVPVTIAGATQEEYNGSFTIQITSVYSFTYEVDGSPATIATGTITAEFTSASVEVQSVANGKGANQVTDFPFSFTSSITGINAIVSASFGGITGGADTEDSASYRARIVDRIHNPSALFNVNAIVNQGKLVTGVTRVFVRPVTPESGQVTIYFVRDGEDSIIPTVTDVATFKEKILEISPVTVAEEDVIVVAPTARTVNFNFNSIFPNTLTLQDAVETNLKELFSTIDVGQDVPSDTYRATITQTIDRTSGDQIETFQLTSPDGNIAIAENEIPILGTVSFL